MKEFWTDLIALGIVGILLLIGALITELLIYIMQKIFLANTIIGFSLCMITMFLGIIKILKYYGEEI